MNAADVMTPDVICAAPDTPLPELVRLMLDHQISALPIVEDGRIVGIVSEGDLLHRAETGTEPRPSRWLELLTSTDRLATHYTKTHGRRAGEIMTRDVVTVADTMPIAEVAHLLEVRRIKRVPVTRDGRLVGIVSRRNLLQALATSLSTPPVTADDRTIRDAFYSELRRQAWAGAPVPSMRWWQKASCISGALRRTRRCGRRSWWSRRTFQACERWRTTWTAGG